MNEFKFEPLKSGKPHGSQKMCFIRTNYLVCSLKKEGRIHREKTSSYLKHLNMQTIKTIPFKHIPILYNLNLYTNFIHSNLSHKICLQVQVQFIGALLKNNLNFGEPSTMGTGMSCLNFVLFFVMCYEIV